ncbi:MAG: FG-GAP-like repeat-containing protein [Bryobacteraceae bacterium]|nr:FG-GAP-like repeat-containing protein [Bryobacteraceae bacterium]
MKQVLLALIAVSALAQVRFEEKTLASDLKGGYQLIATDLNKDGRPDLIALASGMKDLYWFENPGWQRHVLAAGLNRMINTAPLDTNGDGIPELLVAHEFANVARNSIGVVSLVESDGDPRQPWKVREIDRIPTSHRLRPIRLGGGAMGIVNAPLTHGKAEPPDYRGAVPVVLYRPPGWKREPVYEAIEGVMHGIFIFDWDGDGRDELLTASFEGLHLLRRQKDGSWKAEKLSGGDAAAWPKSGSSEVLVGRLGRQRFLASIDPWHGNQVSVYTRRGRRWIRNVIDTAELDGHTLHAADLDGDGFDEVIAGYRGAGRSVYYYKYDQKLKNWRKHAVDKGGIAAAGCSVTDLDADGKPDIACIGSASTNLKLYRNLGPAK